jgi:hypothetical protein
MAVAPGTYNISLQRRADYYIALLNLQRYKQGLPH